MDSVQPILSKVVASMCLCYGGSDSSQVYADKMSADEMSVD